MTAPPAPAAEAAPPAWRPLNPLRSVWGWNNRLLVEEVGPTTPGNRRFRWRVARIGGASGVAKSRDDAFRQAESAAGLAEQPVLNLLLRNLSHEPEQLTI